MASELESSGGLILTLEQLGPAYSLHSLMDSLYQPKAPKSKCSEKRKQKLPVSRSLVMELALQYFQHILLVNRSHRPTEVSTQGVNAKE